MGFPTQSAHAGQIYSMGSVNPSNGISDAPPLARQKSIYSLTLEEFQNTLGEPNKSFGSMNMEELLKNIWTAEESQAMVAAMGNADRPGAAIITQPSLPRQGSYSIRGAWGRKTVDQVWKSVFQEHSGSHGESSLPSKPRQVTFGEITLEDFLMKAGVVKEEETRKIASPSSFSFGGNGELVKSGRNGFEVGLLPNSSSMLSSSGADLPSVHVDQDPQVGTTSSSLQNGYPNLRGPHEQAFGQSLTADGGAFLPSSANLDHNNALRVAPLGLGGLSSPIGGGIEASLNPGVNYGFNNGMSLTIPTFKADSPHSQSSDGTGTSQGNFPSSPVFESNLNGPLPIRKRLAEGPAEMVVERRQRRMIKNRESAARSRARKQAYTVELENELSQLREENSMLMQKQEVAEKKLKQVLAVSQDGKKRRAILRRTRTVPW